ncbi:succinylglutamate desuccinylase [Thalassotalea sp. PP2-459]|uniref:succinylglutamate desuccinylase n=1 Tax=Thalassotalea sp. PP2-459 TaxID=1742724 RepID=UPI000B2C77A3|nr:succinylglutamate desuccinylase [Thalassotalea sp. PP2-459]
MGSLQQQLQTTGDFLALSREHPWSLPETFSFDVTHQATTSQCTVSVFDTGIISFSPKGVDTTQDIVLSSGVHGNETAPIEICRDIIQKIILGQLNVGQRVLFIFGNIASMNIAERFVEENMNRLFSGGHSLDQGNGAGLINKERERALLLENTIKQFFEHGATLNKSRERMHYDLHTAIRGAKYDKFAVYPYLHGKPRKSSQLQFLLACGVNTVLLSNSPTTTFSYFSSKHFGADAFTIELGKVQPFGNNDMTQFKQVASTLTKLVSGQNLELKAYDENDFHIFTVAQVINRQHEAFELTFSSDTVNFTDFPKDHVLAIDGGNKIKTKHEGEAIIFPNANVAIGQRAMLTVIPASLNEN